MLVGLAPLERIQTLRDLALYGCLNALWNHLERYSSSHGRPSLDILTRGEVVRVAGQRLIPALLVEASEAAGSLSSADGWSSLAEATGIPGSETVAGILAELAARGTLCVLLEAPDLLDLAAGSATRRWIAWLVTVCSTLVAATSGSPSELFSDWTHRCQVNESRLPLHEARRALQNFLQRYFSPTELHQWALFWFGEEVAQELPGPSTTAEQVVQEFIAAAERNDILDLAFFEELKRLRPRYTQDIERVAQAYLDGRRG